MNFRRMPQSLQGRLLVWVLSLVTTVWLLTAALTAMDVRHELDELLDGHLAQAAALLVVQQAGDLEDDDAHADAPTLHRYAPQVAFQVLHDGALVLRSASAPSTPMVEAAAMQAGQFRTVRLGSEDWRVFMAQGQARDVQVLVGERSASRAAIVWAVLHNMLWPLAVALPLLTLVAWWAVHHGMAPLRQLGPQLAARRPDALHPLVLPNAPTEMQPMLDALNALFARISALIDTERRFTADAAHELRTPIAAIRAQAQVAQVASNDSTRTHALNAMLQGCDRAVRLVEQLLTLSRLDAGAPLAAAASQPIRLDELARQVVGDLVPQALAKQQQIEVNADQAVNATGDATLLAVLLRNLADNAIRYSPAGAVVRINVGSDDGHPWMSVQDSGPGMSEADQQRLGDRFFRVLGTEQDGSGLGWSIVRRIATTQRLHVQVGRCGSLGGTQVRVTWPTSA
jgi:two-component system sensor histidine kinase QseC